MGGTLIVPGRHVDDGTGVLRHVRGCRPPTPDHRELPRMRVASPSVCAALPPVAMGMMAPMEQDIGVDDQGQVGDCTGSSKDLLSWISWKAKQADSSVVIPKFSRLALYAWTRDMEGTPLSEDSGCEGRDAIDTLCAVGGCPVDLWDDDSPYDLEPPATCKAAAVKHEGASRAPIADLAALKVEIARWYPVGMGVALPDSTMTSAVAASGEIPLPGPSEKIAGYHWLIACGYDDHAQKVWFKNSWNKTWGVRGFGSLSYRHFDAGLVTGMGVLYTAEGIVLP